jgi:hypothetical protein
MSRWSFSLLIFSLSSSLVAQPDVALGLPPLLASRPMWPILFLPILVEGEPLSHMLICVVGHDHLPLIYLLMTMTLYTLCGLIEGLLYHFLASPRSCHTLFPTLLSFCCKKSFEVSSIAAMMRSI